MFANNLKVKLMKSTPHSLRLNLHYLNCDPKRSIKSLEMTGKILTDC